MSESSSYDGGHRQRAQSLFDYRPRINTELTQTLLNKLISAHRSSIPSTDTAVSSVNPQVTSRTEKKRRRFFLCEPLVAGLVIFPLVVIFWQSGWNLVIEWINNYTAHHALILPGLYVLSQVIFLIIYLNQNRLYDFLVKREFNGAVLLVLQSHSLLTACNYIVQWVCMWNIWDLFTSDDWSMMFISSIAAILALIALAGHPCDLVCAPFIVSFDSVEYNIRIGTPFATNKISETLSKLLNYFYYEHVVLVLSILAWRGWYKLLDVYLFPDNPNLSAGVSLSIGYPLFFLLMYTQSCPMKRYPLATFMELNYPSFISNLRHISAFASSVLVWRGFWILFDTHIATISWVYTSPYLSYASFMLVSFVILTLMRTASSINGPMSHMSDEYDLFPFYPNCFLVKWYNARKQSTDSTPDSPQLKYTAPYTITVF